VRIRSYAEASLRMCQISIFQYAAQAAAETIAFLAE
jgi:hypothetical protein